MKKKTFIIILCFVLLGSSIYVVLDLTKKEISVSELNGAADYVILASTHKFRCVYGKEVEEIKYIKTYEKNGKYYTEVYVDCPVKESIGEVITIESDENYIEEALSLEEEYLKTEENLNIRRAMDKLKADYSQALWLLYFESFTYKEAAGIMKRSVKQFDNLVYRAKKALREELEKEGVVYEGL